MEESLPFRVQKVIVESGNLDELPELGRTMDQIGLDSLDMVEVVIALEEEFKIEISDTDWTAVQAETTVDQVIGIVAKYLP